MPCQPLRARTHEILHFAVCTIALDPVPGSNAQGFLPPRGPSISGGFALITGCQEILRVHKMGKT
jgi:hypothetical protein